MVKASALQSVDLDSFPLSSHTKKIFKMVSTASLLGIWHLNGGCGEQVSKFTCCVLGQGTNKTPPPLCGRQVAQFSLKRKGCWQEGHLTIKKHCHIVQNVDQNLSAVVTPNWEKSKKTTTLSSALCNILFLFITEMSRFN